MQPRGDWLGKPEALEVWLAVDRARVQGPEAPLRAATSFICHLPFASLLSPGSFELPAGRVLVQLEKAEAALCLVVDWKKGLMRLVVSDKRVNKMHCSAQKTLGQILSVTEC